MPKSRAADMKRSRQKRKEAGLVEFRCWCTPQEREAIELALKDIKASQVYGTVIEALAAGGGTVCKKINLPTNPK